ncbi:MAG: hypothetical protein GX481_09125, partial [Atopobium sp.]|nr:hypothetical protein [Atopobium sp.]
AVVSSVLVIWGVLTVAVVMRRGYRFAFTALLPCSMLAGIGAGYTVQLLQKQKLAFRYLPELLWILIGAAVFSVLLILYGWIPSLIGLVVIMVLYFTEVYAGAKMQWPRCILSVVLCITMLFPSGTYDYAAVASTDPLVDDAEKTMMDWIRDHTEDNAIIASWWDYGYYYQYESERRTLADGSTYSGQAFSRLGAALMAENPDDSAKLFRELAGDDTAPIYLVLTPEVISRSSVIAYYGLWDATTGTSNAPDSLDIEKYTMLSLYYGDSSTQTAFTKVYEAEDPDQGNQKMMVWKIN